MVDQTASNLAVGGKYHHLLGPNVQVIKFSEIPSITEWDRILESKTGLTILVSTVAAWNSAEKDERLNVHRVHPDWGPKSRWERLKVDRRRTLWVVYDEAHNTTTEQIEQLDDLEPAGFFVASASPVGGKLQLYLTNLPESVRTRRIVPVSTRAVVDAELLKSVISLADYQSSDVEMIQDVAKKRQALEAKFKAAGVPVTPKAIYVVETSGTVKGIEPRPVYIWKTLTQGGVSPANIAICTNTAQKDLPKSAIKVNTIDQLSDDFTHIVFNKKLQEGWDDPAVYVCYFDGKTDSATRIEQVIGRALRQPGAKHLSDEDLNTAYFYLRCPNEALEKITDRLKEELRIYKSDDDEPDFEPFKFKEERKALPPIPLKDKWQGKLKVPRLQPELPEGDPLRKMVEKETLNFDEADRASPGSARSC